MEREPAAPCEGFEQWLHRAQIGSSEALGQVLELCRQYLLLVANRELDTGLQAKLGPSDVVQETLLEAQRDFGQFHGKTEADVLAWLRRILLNNVANIRASFRSTQKRALGREVPLEQVLRGSGHESLAHREPSPSKREVAGEQNVQLEQAVAQLPALYQETLRLRHQENCSFEEIGERMGRSAGAARKLWARAVEQLKQILKPSYEHHR